MDDTEYYVEHVMFAVLREVDAETHTAVSSFNAAPRCCARAVRELCHVQGNSGYMDDTEYYTEHLVFAILREVDAETHTDCIIAQHRTTMLCASCVMTGP